MTIPVHFELPIEAGGQEAGKMDGAIRPSQYLHLLVETVPTLGETFSLCCCLGGRVGRGEGNGVCGGGRPQGGQQEEGGMGWLNRSSRALVYNEISTM